MQLYQSEFIDVSAKGNEVDVNIKVGGVPVVTVKPNVENILGLFARKSCHPTGQTGKCQCHPHSKDPSAVDPE
jgi:hypothetical protein